MSYVLEEIYSHSIWYKQMHESEKMSPLTEFPYKSH